MTGQWALISECKSRETDTRHLLVLSKSVGSYYDRQLLFMADCKSDTTSRSALHSISSVFCVHWIPLI